MLGRIAISLLALPAASAFTLPDGATTAGEGELRVEWSSPPGCPSAQDAVDRVRGLLQKDVGEVLHRPLEARALVTPQESGKFRLELETRQGEESGVRSVEADSCQELTQVGALVIALTIDPELLERTNAAAAPAASASAAAPAASASAAPPEPPPPVEPQRVVLTDSEPEPSARRPRSVRLGPALAAVADAGTLPGVGVGFEFNFHGQWTRWRLELGGVWLPPRQGFVAGSAEVGGYVDLVAAAARACWLSPHRALRGGLCGSFELGRRSADGFGVLNPGSGTAVWVTPGIGLSGSYEFARGFLLRARLEGLVPLERSEFIIENVGPVHSPSAVVGRLAIGADADF